MKIKKKALKSLHEELGKAVSSAKFYSDHLTAVKDRREMMKREAGYTQDASFDEVWANVLGKARKYDKLKPEEKGEFGFKYIIEIVYHQHDGTAEVKTRCLSCGRTLIVGLDGESIYCVCNADQDELLNNILDEYEAYQNFKGASK
jgi:hypothetical protein